MTNKKTTLDKKNALSALGNADSLAQGEAMRNFWAQCAGPDLMDAFKLPPAAQRLQSVMDEAAAWQRKEDIKQVFGALLAEQARKESEELQLAIEREEFNRIERDEMARLSARAKWQASQQAEQAAKVAPAPAPATDAATPAPVTGSASNAPAWTVIKPLRYNGYTAPLHRLIAAAHRDGKPCPTARDVVEAWRNNAPAEIAKVLPDGFDYYDTKGDTKTADLEAIRKAIGRMTSAR